MSETNGWIRDECGDFIPAGPVPTEWVGDNGVAYASPGDKLEADLSRLFRLGYERTSQGGPNWADPANYTEPSE